MPDKKLARRLKRSYDAVAARRLNKGIPPCNPKRKSWRPEDDKVLGTRPDDQIAMLLRRTVASIKNRRRKLGIRSKRARLSRPWTKNEDQLLGTRPDPELAHKLGRGLQSIRNLLPYAQFLYAEKISNPALEKEPDIPPDKMLIHFTRADVVVLGSGLKRLTQEIQKYELKFVKSADRQFAAALKTHIAAITLTLTKENVWRLIHH